MTGFTYCDKARNPIRISLGCHLLGAALPVPDISHSPSQIEGCVKRIGVQMPPINRARMRRFKRFVHKFLELHFSDCRFHNDENFEFDEYIEATNYSRKRKENLKDTHSKHFNENGKARNCKGFTKDENYPEYKHFRGIMSRSDDYKTRVGPFFQKFDKILFSKKQYIKKIPVTERPAWLTDKFKHARDIFNTDFTSFEATFGREMMKIERMVYSWFLKYNYKHDEIMQLFDFGINNTNTIRYRDFTIKIDRRRMSGEMNTSGGNGLMNLMMTYFILYETGNSLDLQTAFEGDDGQVEVDKCMPSPQLYSDLGAKIKIEIPSSPSEASFCGLVYDVDALDNVTDPIDSLMSFGYTTAQYIGACDKKLKALLRSKSLSMLYEYPACPILKSLSLYGLRMTNDIDDKYMKNVIEKMRLSVYYRDQWIECINNINTQNMINKPIHNNSRYLVQKKFNIPILVQLEIEKYLDNLTQIQPLDLPQILTLVHPDTIKYYSDYGTTYISPKQIFSKTPARPYKLWRRCNNNDPNRNNVVINDYQLFM